MKLRNYAVIKAGYGSMTGENKSLIPTTDDRGDAVSPIHTFNNEPYVELGYGVENIFKIGTFGFSHRLNYQNLPNARLFGVNLGIRLQF